MALSADERRADELSFGRRSREAKRAAQVPRSHRRFINSVGSRSIYLTFHGIGEPERPLDPGEDEVWLDPGDVDSVLDSVAERSDVRVTFDDGNASDLEHALPALLRRGLVATFFVVVGRLGEPGCLDARGVRALVAAGMAIGCHGMRHRPWRGLDEPALREELVDAKRLLEEIVERPVTAAACPFGSYDRRVLRGLERAGYRRVYTSDGGTTRPEDWIRARNTIRPGNSAGLLERVVSVEKRPHGAMLRRARLAAKRWR
jgi:peptidoglycan/xylan/chitin deacetylase (PgdA/CDA1 family)